MGGEKDREKRKEMEGEIEGGRHDREGRETERAKEMGGEKEKRKEMEGEIEEERDDREGREIE